MSKQSYSELKHLKVCSNQCQFERSFGNFCHWPRTFLHDLSHEIFPVPTTPVGNINLVMLAFLLLPRYLSVYQLPFEDKVALWGQMPIYSTFPWLFLQLCCSWLMFWPGSDVFLTAHLTTPTLLPLAASYWLLNFLHIYICPEGYSLKTGLC